MPQICFFVLFRAASSSSKDVWKLPRVFIDEHMSLGTTIACSKEISHYLANVLRLREDDTFRAFNCSTYKHDTIAGADDNTTRNSSTNRIRSSGSESGGSGEFVLKMSRVPQMKQKRMKNYDVVHAEVISKIKDSTSLNTPLNLPVCLYFALMKKKDKVKLLLEKTTELGVPMITPMITERTQGAGGGGGLQWDAQSLVQILIDATEQSERLYIPNVAVTPITLPQILSDWQKRADIEAAKSGGEKVQLLVCRERLETQTDEKQVEVKPLLSVLLQCSPKQFTNTNITHAFAPSFGILVGPEGGFTTAEWELCAAHSVVSFVSLGKGILRAETASIAAVSVLAAAVEHFRRAHDHSS